MQNPCLLSIVKFRFSPQIPA